MLILQSLMRPFSLSMLFKFFAINAVLSLMSFSSFAGEWGGFWPSFGDQDVLHAVTKEVTQSTDKTIDETLSRLNKTMPTKLDQMTTLMALKRADHTIVYEYVFNVSHSTLTIDARKSLRQKVIDVTCGDSNNLKFLRSGKEFLYKYSSLNGSLLLGQKVTAKYCEG